MRPIPDSSVLKAIGTEAQTLMTTMPTNTDSAVPKQRWPVAIASLTPESVIVGPDGVDILIKPYFDGGWGYFIPRSGQTPLEPAGRFSALDHGVYWYHPY